ncbi:MAG TPA: CBS domain-containing protein [Bacilli bacterium]|nr:CBS domain-containing protein [Bacilli bacterium]
MKIRELMTTDVRTCKTDDSLQQAAAIMADLDVGVVPVVHKENHLQGIITDRDIVVRACAKGMDINTTVCSDCMTSAVVTVNPETDAHEAADLMANQQIRRLCVVEDGRLVGIVALGDMATIGIHENEAGFALSEISEPARPEMH